MKYKPLAWIILIGVFLVLPIFTGTAFAQAPSNYYVTVKPTTPNSPMYTTVGSNWTLSFEATWNNYPVAGTNISNATVTIQVHNQANELLETLSLNTTSGTFTFNYTSSTPDILTFTPTKLIADGKDFTSGAVVDQSANVYGLNAQSTVVWYDTFHVSLVSSDTGILGKVGSTVNVTYLLLPEEGLTLPAYATYNNQTFLPKIVTEANVTINGVQTQETQTPGIYHASSSTIFPTTYLNVKVSQEGWTTTTTGFSFAQNANQQVWIYGVGIGSAFTFAAVLLYLFRSRKTKTTDSFRHPNFPVLGGILLAATSAISLYWGLVGLEGTLHLFDWLPFLLLGTLTFAFGIAGATLAIRKRNQAVVIFAVITPMAMNLVGVKALLDMYQLANPWPIFLASTIISVISGFFICNSDESFQKRSSTPEISN